MKIVRRDKELTKMKDIPVGAAFEASDDNQVYMKLASESAGVNAVRLEDGCKVCFAGYVEVTPLDAEVVIRGKAL